MFESQGLQAIVMLLVAIGAGFVALRGAGAYRGARRTHRGLVIACAIAAVIGATVVVYTARDAVMCPPGYGDPAAAKTRTSSGKGGMKIVCAAADGTSKDGSVFAGVFAWLAVAALGLAGGALVLRAAGVTPAAPPSVPVPPSGPPTDKKERRRARKARERASS